MKPFALSSPRAWVASCVLALAAALPAHAQEYSSGWQAEMDLVSAGAAASIILHYRCAGSAAGEQGTARAIDLVNAYVQRAASQAPAETVRQYVFDAANLKLAAMTQSSDGLGCGQLTRLRDIARGTGFALP